MTIRFIYGALLLLCSAAALFAQPTNVNVVGATATQAVITYTAPSAAACTREVSESSTFTPLHPDVDSSLFSGSNSDGGGALERRWVVGKYGRWYTTDGGDVTSRALRAAFPYHYRITCGSAVSGTFTTSTVPWGNTHDFHPPPPAVGDWDTMPTPPVNGTSRWEGAIPTTGVYMKWPLLLPNATQLWVAFVQDTLVDGDDWTGGSPAGTNALADDEAVVSCDNATCSGWLIVRDNTPLANTATREILQRAKVRLKEAVFDHDGADSTRTMEVRMSMDNGETWGTTYTCVVPGVTAGEGDIDCGPDTYYTMMGVPEATPLRGKQFVQLDAHVTSNGVGATNLMEFDNAADCRKVEEGGTDSGGSAVNTDSFEVRFVAPIEHDSATTRTITASSCAGAPYTATFSGTAKDLDNGGDGVPVAIRTGIYDNHGVQLAVRPAATATGVVSIDAIQGLYDQAPLFDQVDAGNGRECGIENSDGWALCPGNGYQTGSLSFALYAIRYQNRQIDINLYGASGYARNQDDLAGRGCASSDSGASGLGSLWSRGGADQGLANSAWRTRYFSTSCGGDTMLYKAVLEKTDPQNALTPPLDNSSDISARADYPDITLTLINPDNAGLGFTTGDLIQDLIAPYATAKSLSYDPYWHGQCGGLAFVGGNAAGDWAQIRCRSGSQDTPGMFFLFDLGNGLPCGDGVGGDDWVSSIDAGTDCTETDGTGMIIGHYDAYFDRSHPDVGSSDHSAAVDPTWRTDFRPRLQFSPQFSKTRQMQPTWNAVMDDADVGTVCPGTCDDLAASSSSTPITGVVIQVSSELPSTTSSPSCDGWSDCSTTISCADSSTTVTCGTGDHCKYQTGNLTGNKFTAGGQTLTVTDLNADGSVEVTPACSPALTDAAFTIEVVAPAWWEGGDPIGNSPFTFGGEAADLGVDNPMFAPEWAPGNYCSLSNDPDTLDIGDSDVEVCQIESVSDNGDGTKDLTITRRMPGSGATSTGPYIAGSSYITFRQRAGVAGGSLKDWATCDVIADPDCSEATLTASCCHSTAVTSQTDQTKDIKWAAAPVAVQHDIDVEDHAATHQPATITPAFAGISDSTLGQGNSSQKHISVPGLDPALGGKALTSTDHYDLMGGGSNPSFPTQDNDAVTLVAGRSYTYEVDPVTDPIYPKRMPFVAFVGPKMLTTKAGPSSSLLDTDVDRFCFAAVAGECIGTSSAGDFYFVSEEINPGRRYCADSQTANTGNAIDGVYPGCFFPILSTMHGVTETYLRKDYDGTNQIDLGYGWGRVLVPLEATRGKSVFYNAQPANDNMDIALTVVPGGTMNWQSYAVFEYPPLASDTSQQLDTFRPITIDVVQAAGANDAIVEFGYGIDPDNPLRCAPDVYLGKCVVTAPTITEATPFQWESESLASTISFSDCRGTGVQCAKIDIPVLPNRVLFYRVIQRDAGDATVSTGATEVVVVR